MKIINFKQYLNFFPLQPTTIIKIKKNHTSPTGSSISYNIESALPSLELIYFTSFYTFTSYLWDYFFYF